MPYRTNGLDNVSVAERRNIGTATRRSDATSFTFGKIRLLPEFYTCKCVLANDFSSIHQERLTVSLIVSVSPRDVVFGQRGIVCRRHVRRGRVRPNSCPFRKSLDTLISSLANPVSDCRPRHLRGVECGDLTFDHSRCNRYSRYSSQDAAAAFHRKRLADLLTLLRGRPTIDGIGSGRSAHRGGRRTYVRRRRAVNDRAGISARGSEFPFP